ncbi:MAG: ABC transporter permease [Candidatus Hadarchaeum sp.]|uniref:ABC transporter permease n=1 Tax=Candidatus Hadarchaeum sp. TaxID=2883567 RepID=UPI00316E5AC0
MMSYVIRRILRIVVVLFLAVTLVFLLFRLVPGGLEYTLTGGLGTQAALEKMRELLGLNEPLFHQYGKYISGLLKGDLGWTLIYNAPVRQVIIKYAPATFSLLGATLFIIVFIGIPVGSIAATTRRSQIMWPFYVLYSIPYYVVGLFMMSLFSVRLGLLPSFGRQGLLSYIMPSFALAWPFIVITARVTQVSIGEVLQADYVTTGRAKGLSEWSVIIKHVMRNALLPILTMLGLQAGYLLGGNVIVETLFAWPGMGRLIIEAARARDYPMLQGITIFFTVGFLVINLIVDIIYGLLDPRIHYA